MRWTIALMALLLAGCGKGGEAAEEGAGPVADVSTAIASLGTSSEQLVIYGTTDAGPAATHTLTAPAEAVVSAVLAGTGTAVHAGQPAIQLTPSRTTRIDLAKAASDFAVADAAYRRALRLKADGLASNAEVEAARGAMRSASAARAALAGAAATLRAPVDGIISVTVKPGDQVAAGTALATVMRRGNVRARFGVDPAVAQRIHPGQQLQIILPDGRESAASVIGVDLQVDPATRLASVYAAVPDVLNLGPGQPLRARLTVGAVSSSVTIPYAALLDDGGRSYVFIVRGGIAKSTDVAPGNSMGDRIQILRGVKPGDRVVVEGGTALEDGMKVRDTGGRATK